MLSLPHPHDLDLHEWQRLHALSVVPAIFQSQGLLLFRLKWGRKEKPLKMFEISSEEQPKARMHMLSGRGGCKRVVSSPGRQRYWTVKKIPRGKRNSTTDEAMRSNEEGKGLKKNEPARPKVAFGRSRARCNPSYDTLGRCLGDVREEERINWNEERFSQPCPQCG